MLGKFLRRGTSTKTINEDFFFFLSAGKWKEVKGREMINEGKLLERK